MFNFFEQPYTLIGLAVIVLFGLFTFRSVFPEKRSRKQWLIPLCVVVLAFALDFIVKTDREKLNALINKLMAAVEREDPAAIEPLIAADYQDSYHKTKADLMARCRKTLADIYIQKGNHFHNNHIRPEKLGCPELQVISLLQRRNLLRQATRRLLASHPHKPRRSGQTANNLVPNQRIAQISRHTCGGGHPRPETNASTTQSRPLLK